MTDVAKEIIEWLRKQQDWLQEAAERLLASGTLVEQDVGEIANRLKTREGQKITTHRGFEGLGVTKASADEARLISIGDISGIENLAPRSPLNFGKGNFAVIYGHNGSGKSGFTRIIKRACGHPRAVELKPNVFQPTPEKRQCTITFSLAGTEKSVTWDPDGDPIKELKAVDIFDSDVAAYYLMREKEPTYTPPQVAFFEELASACDRVKRFLQSEQDQLASCLPTLPAEYEHTQVAGLYRSLKPDIADQDLARLVQWTSEDAEALEALSERLKTADPAAQARKARQQKKQMEQLAEQLRTSAAATSQGGLQAIRELRRKAKEKRQIATEAGQLKSAHLDGVGSATWVALWKTARAYSQIAYPGKDYPVIEEDARCVLCQQELAPDARQRLQDFEDFVQGTVEKDAKRAEEEYKQALEELPKTPSTEALKVHCEAAGLDDEDWLQKFVESWEQVRQVCDKLQEGETKKKATATPKPEALLTDLMERRKALEKRTAAYEEDAKQFDRKKAEKQKKDLEAKRWTTQQQEAIKAEIRRLKKAARYEDWKKRTNSRPVSLKAGEVAEKVITQAYVDRFNGELARLGASNIRVELVKTQTKRGVPLHQVRLKNAKEAPDSVLSEGERRVVSLAAFLADVGEKPHPAPFVFDDPISSLDDEFEWHVAIRLAKLANERQVLVFTHRLSLYGMAEDAAKKMGEGWKKSNLEQRCIESFGGAAGHPANDAVWSAKTTTANNKLLQRLDAAKKAGEQEGAASYRGCAQGICTDFRKLLERTIEDDLLDQIIRRHRRSVQTDNKLGSLPRINSDDCEILDRLMTKYSAFEHSQSPETPAPIPDEPELRRDIESLKDWREKFKKRPVDGVA